MPGAGSASRAGPIGINGEAAMATPTARTAPARVTAATRARDNPARLARVMPSARRIGNSTESSTSWRASSWPITTSPISPARTANIASATACGRIARSVAATWSDKPMTTICPPLAG